MRGSFLEELTYGGKFELQNQLGLGRQIRKNKCYHFCFVLLCISVLVGNFPWELIYSGERFNGVLFGELIFGWAFTWRGFFSEFFGTLSGGNLLRLPHLNIYLRQLDLAALVQKRLRTISIIP